MHSSPKSRSVTSSSDSDSSSNLSDLSSLAGPRGQARAQRAGDHGAQLLGHARRGIPGSLQRESSVPSLASSGSSGTTMQSRSQNEPVEEKEQKLKQQQGQQQQHHPIFHLLESEHHKRPEPPHKQRPRMASTSVDVTPNNEWNPDYPQDQPPHPLQHQQQSLHQQQQSKQQHQRQQKSPYKMFSFRTRAMSLDTAEADRRALQSQEQQQPSRRASLESRTRRQPLQGEEAPVREPTESATSSRGREVLGDRFRPASAASSATSVGTVSSVLASPRDQAPDVGRPELSPLLGSWRSDEAENWDELLKAAGVGVIARRVSMTMVSYEYITLSQDGKWSIKMNNALSSFQSSFHLNEVYEEENFDGKKCRAIAILDPSGHVLTIRQTALEKDGVAYCIVREVQDDTHMQATVTCLLSGVVAKKYFIRIQNDSNKQCKT